MIEKSRLDFLQSNFMFLFTFRQRKAETLVNRLLSYEARLQKLRLEITFRNVSIGKQMNVICWEYYTQVSIDILGALVKLSLSSID